MASMIRNEGNYVDSLLIYVQQLEASDKNFQTIWIPKEILAKILSERSWSWFSALSLFSATPRLVRPPNTRIICPY